MIYVTNVHVENMYTYSGLVGLVLDLTRHLHSLRVGVRSVQRLYRKERVMDCMVHVYGPRPPHNPLTAYLSIVELIVVYFRMHLNQLLIAALSGD